MKKYGLQRLFSLLLCLLLCLGTAGCGETLSTGISKETLHGEIPFAQMELSGESGTGLLVQLEALETYLQQGGDIQTAFARYAALAEAYNHLKGDEALLYIRRCKDMTDAAAGEAYLNMSSLTLEAEYRLTDLELLLMEVCPEAFDPAYIQEVQRRDGLNSVHAQSLFQQESSLCQAYEALRTGLTVDFGGKSWSYQELMMDTTLPIRDFFAALELYENAFYAEAGEIYLKLLQVRKKLATTLGFSSYQAYAYTRFGRGYGQEEVESWAQAVKQYLAPLYGQYRRELDDALEYLQAGEFSEETALFNLRETLSQTFPQGVEAWDYMMDMGLYDSEVSGKKLRGSFTTYLSGYESPYLFTQWENRAGSLSTVIHEFGHFLAFYENPEATCYGGSLDLAEVDSQGLELLLFDQYGALFGEAYGEAAQISALLDGLYGVLAGFMEDEFQRRAFEMESPTVEKLNRLYLSLAQEYGLLAVFSYTGREWMDIGHTFSYPFYYISYGVSMLGALKLWRMEQSRPGKGWRGYEKLLMRQGDWDFEQALRRCGLGQPLSQKEIQRTGEAVEGWLKAVKTEA